MFLTGSIWLFTFTADAAFPFPFEVRAASKASTVGAIDDVIAEHEDEELEELELEDEELALVGPAAAGPFVEEV